MDKTTWAAVFIFFARLDFGLCETVFIDDSDSDHYRPKLGIPFAPHSINGAMHGLHFICNQTSGIQRDILPFQVAAMGMTAQYPASAIGNYLNN